MKSIIKPGKILIIAFLMMTMALSQVNAQKFITKNGFISFHSETPIETIQAENNQVNAAMDIQTGDIVFKVLMKSFEFPKALMQEHFNENYVESDKYPNALLKGKIINIKDIDFNTPGTYDAIIDGDLTIHGVTNHINEKGTFQVLSPDQVQGESKFTIADYKIKIPKAVTENIAETVNVTVKIDMKKL